MIQGRTGIFDPLIFDLGPLGPPATVYALMVLTGFVSSPTPVILRQRATLLHRCSAGQHGSTRGVMYIAMYFYSEYGCSGLSWCLQNWCVCQEY